jgi:hypothetical protein
MGWSNTDTTLLIVTTTGGTFSGIFIYNGPPGPGQLIGSWASASGTDPYGNSYVAGLEIQNLGAIIAKSGNAFLKMIATSPYPQLAFNPDTTLYQDGGFDFTSQAGTINIQMFTGAPIAGGNGASLSLSSESSGVGSQSQLEVVCDQGFISSWLANASTFWHTPSYNAGWAGGGAGGGLQPFQFRIDNENNLYLEGALHSTSATPNGTIFTLPTGYRPTTTRRIGVETTEGGNPNNNICTVNSTGTVSFNRNFTAASVDGYFDSFIPLGAIA